MRSDACKDIREQLVDYADGTLSAEESRGIAEHLRECAACRETVADLRLSLSLAQAIWSNHLAQAETRETKPVVTKTRGLHYIAAAAVFVIAGVLVFVTSHGRPEEETLTFEQIEQQIDRTASAARLLAATNLIAQCEGTESIVARQYRHILDHYGDTPAAATLRIDKQAVMKGKQND